MKQLRSFFRIIRKLLCISEECSEAFTGEIECDETTCGGKRPEKRGLGAAGKIIVLGILKRNSKILVFPNCWKKK